MSFVTRKDGTAPVPLSQVALAKQIHAFISGARGMSRSSRLQVVFFCDTTGSMYPYYDRVRASLAHIIDRVMQEGIGIECALYAYKNHGDETRYFDGAHPFLYQPLTANAVLLTGTLTRLQKGGGGDGLCAVEDAFHHANATAHDNASPATRIGVVVGDMPPHGVLDSASSCPHKYDYRAEVVQLQRKGFSLYSVCCSEENGLFSNRKRRILEYFRWIAQTTGGKCLELSDLESLIMVILGICMRATGRLDSFFKDIEGRRVLTPHTRRLLLELKE